MRRVLPSLLVLLPAAVASGQVTASSVVAYDNPAETTFTLPTSALGLPARNNAGLDLNVFNPNFGADQIVRLQPGGSLTLRLSSPVPVLATPTLGVVSNVGIADVSPDGSGLAGTPATSFGAFPVARVSVSADGVAFADVNGAGLEEFQMPANGFTDTPPYTGYSPSGGVTPSDFWKPTPAAVQAGGLAAFSGVSYSASVSLLQGSGGGTWFSLAGTGLTAVNFVKFEVPAGSPAGTRMILDAVVAVPEPVSLSVASGLVLVAMRRRR